MDTSTFDLYRVLHSGPYDEAGLNQVKRLLGGQRRLLRGKNDLHALEQLIPLLQDWAAAAGGGWLSASALAEAAEIAELDLRNTARAEQLRSQAIATGRAASGMPAPLPESLAMEGAIDANAELLHELKTLPPGALTQTLLTESESELEPELVRESSIPRPRSVPAPALHSDLDAHSDSSVPARPRSVPPPAFHSESDGQIESSFPARPRSVPAAAVLRSGPDAQRDSSVEVRQRSTPIPAALLSEDEQSDSAFAARARSLSAGTMRGIAEAQGDARARSVPAAAPRAEVDPRRATLPRAGLTAAARAEPQARRASVSTQPIRLTPLPQMALGEQVQEQTQEVHTADLELHPISSMPPLRAADAANDEALSAAIAQAEQALESDTSSERVRELAELYVKRDAEGDREQAADLYSTLGEVLGNPAGTAMLERALALVPDHAEAKALLTRYAVRPRMPISSPKITVLGTQPKLGAPQPPAAALGLPPAAAGHAQAAASPFAPSASLTPFSAASAAQLTAASLPARASLAPVAVQAAARATLPGTGQMNDVLALHGVPQVITTPPPVPQISSLTPIVRSDASELQARRLKVAKNSYVALGGIALSAAAALGLYLSVRATSNNNQAPLARPAVVSEGEGQMAAASQPLANGKGEGEGAAKPALAAVVPAGKSAPLAAAVLAEKPAPLAPPAPSHLPLLKVESAQQRGGKLSEAQLTAALGKAEPKLLACYAEAIEKKPRIKGRVIYSFTVRTNGKATNIKRAGGSTLKDDALLQCSVKVLETVRFPKPRKSAQVKLPIQYKRS